jgi:ribosome-associated protein
VADRRRLPRVVRLALDAVLDRKGHDVRVIDLRRVTDATDFFLIASGTSDAHLRGLSDAVVERLEAAGVHAHHVEGVTGGRWVLIDFVDFVVHLFHPEARAFYQLERLWHDAPVVVVEPPEERKGRQS